MKIKRGSWWYRIYTCYFGAPDFPAISVCGFWGRLIVGVPFISLFLMIVIPPMWCAEKWKNKRGGFCPFGKVEIVDGEDAK